MTMDNEHKKDRFRYALPALGVAWLILASLIVLMQLAKAPQIEITWVTETEFDTAGFNVWRSESQLGEYRKINDHLIPGAQDAAAGAEYRFVDDQVARGRIYYYKLEDVSFDNTTVQHEAISAGAQDISRVALGMAFVCALIGAVLILSSVLGRSSKNGLS